MIGIILVVIGIIGVVGGLTNNGNMMKMVIKQKENEEDAAYLKRAKKMALIIGIVFALLGVLLIIPIG